MIAALKTHYNLQAATTRCHFPKKMTALFFFDLKSLRMKVY